MSEIRVTNIIGENGSNPVGLSTGFTVGPTSGTTGIGVTITHQGHAQFAGVCTASSSIVSSGNVVIGTAGNGIDYSAQTATSVTGASTGSEVLSHYEEGNWTPNLVGLSNTPAYAAQQGKFTRIGRLVNMTGLLQAGGTLPTFTTQTDPLKISGACFLSGGWEFD